MKKKFNNAQCLFCFPRNHDAGNGNIRNSYGHVISEDQNFKTIELKENNCQIDCVSKFKKSPLAENSLDHWLSEKLLKRATLANHQWILNKDIIC